MRAVVKVRASARTRDRVAAAAIALAAFTVLGFTFLLLVYLVVESWPLAKPAQIWREATLNPKDSLRIWPAGLPGSTWELLSNGSLRLRPLGQTLSLPEVAPPVVQVALDPWGRALALEDQESVKVYQLNPTWLWQGQSRVPTLRLKLLEHFDFTGGKLLAVAGETEVRVVVMREGATYLLGRGRVTKLLDVAASAATLGGKLDQIWLATGEELYLLDREKVLARAPLPAPPTAMTLLLGDLTCLVGDQDGSVTAFNVLKLSGRYFLDSLAVFAGEGPVLALAPSPRNKAFAVVRPKGVEIGYLTSRKRVARMDVPNRKGVTVFFSPRGDGLLVDAGNGSAQTFRLHLGHPEVTWKTLFGKVRYEGTKERVWSWQSTGGSNAFESKFSLIPLIFGSLKGAAYAMLFSAPLGLLAALYTSQFASEPLRRVVKPVVELLASVPSVVVGFLAALVLAPWLARNLEGVILVLGLLPAAIYLAGKLGEACPRHWQRQLQRRGEMALATFLVAGSVWLGLRLGPWLGKVVFGGSLMDFLQTRWGLPYDQRNALVAGFALGFAVLPLVFTLAEEALSNVPEHLAYAALSLGASKARAAWTVVVPAATPGLVAAMLLGFGRAVGETMIVLMASGNAPLLSASPLVGMRTMAACIAVELPEAAYGDSLYRVLFVVALLLFAFTLLTNFAGQKIGAALKRRFEVSS